MLSQHLISVNNTRFIWGVLRQEFSPCVLILLPGLSQNKGEFGYLYTQIAAYCSKQGITTLQIDPLAHGDSNGTEKEITMSTLKEDILASIQWAKDNIVCSNVFLLTKGAVSLVVNRNADICKQIHGCLSLNYPFLNEKDLQAVHDTLEDFQQMQSCCITEMLKMGYEEKTNCIINFLYALGATKYEYNNDYNWDFLEEMYHCCLKHNKMHKVVSYINIENGKVQLLHKGEEPPRKALQVYATNNTIMDPSVKYQIARLVCSWTQGQMD